MRVLTAGLAAAFLFVAAGAGQAAEASAPIAFATAPSGHILLPIKVGAEAVEALLDSGADVTVLDRGYAESHGIVVKDALFGTVKGLSGRGAKFGHATVDLQIGDLVLKDRSVVVLDLSDLSRRLRRPLPMILGVPEVFDRNVVDIDFKAKTLRLVAPKDFRAPDGAPSAPLSPTRRKRSFPVAFAGGAPVQATFDLGSDGTLLLTDELEAERQVFANKPTSTKASQGVDGTIYSRLATIDGVKIGDVTLDKVPVEAAKRNATAPVNAGLGVLGRFHLYVDFPDNRLWLQPYADTLSAPFVKNRAGLQAVSDGDRWTVDMVATGSPAAGGGWAPGDVVTAIDGVAVGDSFLKRVSGPPGTVVEFTMAGGAKRRLTLSDYY